eukprot:361944-Chlamydomonas_euryale.AAC.3
MAVGQLGGWVGIRLIRRAGWVRVRAGAAGPEFQVFEWLGLGTVPLIGKMPALLVSKRHVASGASCLGMPWQARSPDIASLNTSPDLGASL